MAQIAGKSRSTNASSRLERRSRTFQADLSAEYSWEQLQPHQRRKVRAMLHTAAGRRKAQLLTVLIALCVLLIGLGAAFFLPLPFLR